MHMPKQRIDSKSAGGGCCGMGFIAELPRPEGPLGTEPNWHHGKSKDTHEVIFFVIIVASGIARGRIRTTTTTESATWRP